MSIFSLPSQEIGQKEMLGNLGLVWFWFWLDLLIATIITVLTC